MRIIITPEIYQILKNKEFDCIVLNFDEKVIRFIIEEKSKLSGKTNLVFYHVQSDSSIHSAAEKGCVNLSKYYLSALRYIVKPNDEVYFNIGVNGTKALTEAGFHWKMIQSAIYRKGKNIADMILENSISRNEPYTSLFSPWNEIRFNQFFS